MVSRWFRGRLGVTAEPKNQRILVVICRLALRRFLTPQGPKIDDSTALFGTQGPKIDDSTALFGTQGPNVDDSTALFGTQGPKVGDSIALFGTQGNPTVARWGRAQLARREGAGRRGG